MNHGSGTRGSPPGTGTMCWSRAVLRGAPGAGTPPPVVGPLLRGAGGGAESRLCLVESKTGTKQEAAAFIRGGREAGGEQWGSSPLSQAEGVEVGWHRCSSAVLRIEPRSALSHPNISFHPQEARPTPGLSPSAPPWALAPFQQGPGWVATRVGDADGAAGFVQGGSKRGSAGLLQSLCCSSIFSV